MPLNLTRLGGTTSMWLAWVVCWQVAFLAFQAGAQEPGKEQGQPWRLLSFAMDAQLAGKNVFHIDFQGDKNSSTLEKVWLATSGGLVEYDGYHWRKHGVAQGLPSDFVRCVLVTRGGELWVGTDRGAGIYDGRMFRTMGSETNLAGPSVRRMVEDVDGTIWFCSDPWPSSARSGGLTSFRDRQWRPFTVKDGLPSEYAVNFFRDSSNRRWVVTKDGIAMWGGSNWVTAITPEPGRDSFSSGCFAEVPGRQFMFSAGADAYEFQNDGWKLLPVSARNLHHQHGICATKDGRILSSVSTSPGRKMISGWNGSGWEGLSAEFDLPRGYNEDIRESPDGNIWVVGFETVICWRRNAQWDVFRKVPPPKFVEASNRIWFGKDGWGVLPALTPVRLESGRWEQLVSSYDDLFPDEAGSVWGWKSNRVTRWVGNAETQFTESETGLRVIQAGRGAKFGAYWVVGLDRDKQLATARFLNGGWLKIPGPRVSGTFSKPGIAANRDSLCILLRSSSDTNAYAIHISTNKTTLVDVPRTILSEFHHGLHLESGSSRLWLYGDNGLYHTRIGTGKWETVTNLPGRTVVGMVERAGEIWVGCNGVTGGRVGLARYRDGEWKSFPARSVMNISMAADQTVLVGGKGCFTVVEDRPDAIPYEVEFPEEILAEGIVKDATGDYWAGNIAKLLRFHPDEVPPETRIIAMVTNILEGGRLTVGIGAVERFRPLGQRADYSFSWKLGDQEWRPFEQGLGGEISIPGLGIGRHTIAVRARDSGGDIDPTPSILGFTIHPLPLQSRTWFLWSVAAVILLLASLSLIAVRARTELASYARSLERRVADRTAALEADLVERRRAEAALRESEERWQFALEGSGDGLWDWNIQTNAVHFSSRWKSMLGYQDDEICDALEEWDKRVHPEDKARVVNQLSSHLDGGVALYVSEHRLLCKDGSYKWILDRGKVMTRTPDGRPMRIIGTHSDITERKESERIVRETQERFQQLAENIREVFWLTNAEKSQMLYISPGYERVWGRSCESLYKSPGSWLESIHAEDQDRVVHSILESQSQGTYNVEYRILRPDGSARWIHDRAFPVRDASGTVYRIAGIAEDITERRQFEAQYRQAQKMEALGTLSGGIAHDFNNILGAIVGNVQLASLDLEPTHPATQSLCEIQKAANRARDLVQQILAFSRRQPKTRQSLRLETVVREAVGLLRASLPAGIELVKTLDPNAPNVFADATQIHQIVLNLCTNAWHAIGDGPGRIEIQVQPVEIRESEPANTSDLRPGCYVRLSVIDTGQGMDSSTLERIFEPFFTTKELGRGTGLGLSVVLGIVQSHEGVIRVSSQLGVGTTFHLYFPTVAAETDGASPAARAVQQGVGQRILYLDDEQPLVAAAVQMLRRLAYQAEGYTDPEAAMNTLRENPSRFQLIITDLHMPGVSGIQFIQSVRSFLPSIPIVLSSGHLTEDVAARARKLGVTRLLHKPNTLEDFSNSIHELLQTSRP